MTAKPRVVSLFCGAGGMDLGFVGAGFEVAYFQVLDQGCRIEGLTTAIEDGVTWAVEYLIDLDETGATRRARIRGRSAAGFSSALLMLPREVRRAGN